jgi:hypothetical protein
MVGDRLTLRFHNHGDGTGELSVQATANGFSGEASTYFDVAELTDFARRIGEFPVTGRPSVSGGLYSNGFYSKTRGRLEQEHVALVCYPADTRGTVAIQVRLATELWPAGRPQSQHSVSLEIVTLYERLRRFSSVLAGLLSGSLEEAVLEGEAGVVPLAVEI